MLLKQNGLCFDNIIKLASGSHLRMFSMLEFKMPQNEATETTEKDNSIAYGG
jgi:hypothetical protein